MGENIAIGSIVWGVRNIEKAVSFWSQVLDYPDSMYVFEKDTFTLNDPNLSKAGITDLNEFAAKFTDYNLFLDAISEDASLEIGFYKKETDETRSYYNLKDLSEEEYDEFLKKMQPGGQKQRIALARALAVRPPILILDDTTSALDLETEKYIQQSLRELDFPCTKIMVAQRISTTRQADKIVILNNGRIAEMGTHEELLAQKGYYYDVFCLQNGIPNEKLEKEGA